MSDSVPSKSPFFPSRHLLNTYFQPVAKALKLCTDLRYNGARNFMQQDLYCGMEVAFLHPEAIAMLVRADKILQSLRPGFQFCIWDALRPQSVQVRMKEFVRGTPGEMFVAEPVPGSLHNFGMAVDLTLVDSHGRALNMGTDFDDFSELAQPQKEPEMSALGRLSAEQFANRQLLRQLLEGEGFRQLPHEWWHFSASEADLVYKSKTLFR